MDSLSNPIPSIQNAKHSGGLNFSLHAIERMLERGLRIQHIEEALDCDAVEILERYPQAGHHSPECLILGIDGNKRPLHVLVAYSCAEVITTYEPEPPRWLTPRVRGPRWIAHNVGTQ